MPSKAIYEPWRSFLNRLDNSLSHEFHFHCIGGFVITHLYGFSRPTSDIDILPLVGDPDILNALLKVGGQGSELHKKYGVYLECVGVAPVPEDYDSRLAEIYPGTFNHLRLFALDSYDLALSKLDRNQQQDRDDVKYLAEIVPFDLEILRKRYHKELRSQLHVPDRGDSTLKLWIEAIEEERNSGLK